MSDHKSELKLFVVGESSGDPDKWSEYGGGYSIVLATDADEAERVSASPGPAIEVNANAACELACVNASDL